MHPGVAPVAAAVSVNGGAGSAGPRSAGDGTSFESLLVALLSQTGTNLRPGAAGGLGLDAAGAGEATPRGDAPEGEEARETSAADAAAALLLTAGTGYAVGAPLAGEVPVEAGNAPSAESSLGAGHGELARPPVQGPEILAVTLAGFAGYDAGAGTATLPGGAAPPGSARDALPSAGLLAGMRFGAPAAEDGGQQAAAGRPALRSAHGGLPWPWWQTRPIRMPFRAGEAAAPGWMRPDGSDGAAGGHEAERHSAVSGLDGWPGAAGETARWSRLSPWPSLGAAEQAAPGTGVDAGFLVGQGAEAAEGLLVSRPVRDVEVAVLVQPGGPSEPKGDSRKKPWAATPDVPGRPISSGRWPAEPAEARFAVSLLRGAEPGAAERAFEQLAAPDAAAGRMEGEPARADQLSTAPGAEFGDGSGEVPGWPAGTPQRPQARTVASERPDAAWNQPTAPGREAGDADEFLSQAPAGPSSAPKPEAEVQAGGPLSGLTAGADGTAGNEPGVAAAWTATPLNAPGPSAAAEAAAGADVRASLLQQLREPLDEMVAELVRSPSRNGVEEVAIRLRPEIFGEVVMRIAVDADGSVTARFFVQHASVRQMIEQQLPELRSMLSQHGLHLADAGVFGGDAGMPWDREPAPYEAPRWSGPAYHAEPVDEPAEPRQAAAWAPLYGGGIDIRV
ncbi:MAG: flagellar hook-length control protein FliK [Bacillota bacterium]